MICFPLTQGSYHPPVIKKSDAAEENIAESERIKWEDIIRIWKKAVPGTDEKKDKAIRELAKVWKQRTGSLPKPSDKIRMNAWLTIAREAIVDQLSRKCGLQLKLTANSTNIFCRIRAPIKLLEQQADRENYMLQLKGEIDPGSEHFWNKEINGKPVELEEEQRHLKIDEAKEILEKLYHAGKIPASELIINPDEETEDVLTRRVHALERIADQVPVTNRYVPYATLVSAKPHLRYLFQTYPSVRGNTLFRSKDRLLLTHSIISNYFDIEVLAQAKLVDLFIPLHDANRGEKLTTSSLGSKWIFFWEPPAKEVGTPTVSHLAYDEDFALSWYLRPFAQPLADIRDYFGEKVALYFAWMGFFTFYLSVPALLGILINLYYASRGYQFGDDDSEDYDYVDYIYVFFVISWAVIYDQSWRRECKAIAIKWGTKGFEEEERARPEFEGDPDPTKAEIRSTINNMKETYYPEYKRNLKIFGFGFLIFLYLLGDLFVQALLFIIQYKLVESNPDVYYTMTFSWIFSIGIAMLIQVASHNFLKIAKNFNDQENHRTDTDYQDHLVTKVIFFEIFNSFAACFFVGFGKKYAFDTCYVNCIYDLRILLYSILFFRIIKALYNFSKTTIAGVKKSVISFVRRVYSCCMCCCFCCDGVMGDLKSGDEENPLLGGDMGNASIEDTYFLAEITKEKYTSDMTFAATSEMFMQFAYINLFSVIVPALAVASFVENLVKIRMDAFRLCNLCHRPPVERAEDAGLWSEYMKYVIFAGIYCNTAIMSFSYPDLNTFTYSMKFIVFLAFSQFLVLYILILSSLIPEDPDELSDIAKRQQFIVDKYVKGFQDDGPEDGSAAGAGPSVDKGSTLVEDNVDLDALNLYDFRKGMTVNDEDHQQMTNLERDRRELLRELKIKKDKLQDIYKSEVFNENTGIGETRHGLPLGRLQLQLIQLEDFLASEEVSANYPAPFRAKFRIELRNRRPGGVAPLPELPTTITDSGDFEITKKQAIDIEKLMGPFAPVRTMDADVYIHLILVPDARNTTFTSELPIASVSFPLRDLQDQTYTDKRLKLKVRDIEGEFRTPSKPPVLSANCLFQYSKVIPLRKDIYAVQEKLQETERKLAQLKSGKK